MGKIIQIITLSSSLFNPLINYFQPEDDLSSIIKTSRMQDGFDFGVGMLLNFIGKNDTEKRITINTVGSVWNRDEGNRSSSRFSAGQSHNVSMKFLVPCLQEILNLKKGN